GALLRVVDAVDDVKHRAFAGAVGSDDGEDLALAHFEAHAGNGLHAAEGERDVLDAEDGGAGIAGNTHHAARFEAVTCGRSSMRTRGLRLPRRRSGNCPSVSISQWRAPP